MDNMTGSEEETWLRNGSTRQNGVARGLRRPSSSVSPWCTPLRLRLALLVLAVALLAVTAVLAAVLVTWRPPADASEDEKEQEICLTTDCVTVAARIQENLDTSVDPCDDLYQFSCGGWERGRVIPQEKSSLSTFTILRDEVDVTLKNLLDEKGQGNEHESIKKAKRLYKSCMDEDRIAKQGDGAMRDLVASALPGGWPAVNTSWEPQSWDLEAAIASLNKLYSFPLISIFVDVDNKNSSRRLLKIAQTSFGMPGQKYYQGERDDKMLMAYQKLIGRVIAELGGDDAEADSKDVVDFEIKLANISVADEDRRDADALYNPTTLAALHTQFDGIFNWTRYVDGVMLLPEVGVTDVTSEETVVNTSPPYYNRLVPLLNQSSPRTVANYLGWRLVFSLIGLQPEPYKQMLMDYDKVLNGVTADQPRYKTCVGYVTAALGLAVGRLFIRDNFKPEAKEMALDMIHGLQESFNKLLDHVEWMDEGTKEAARAKNDAIKHKIGFPEFISNDTYLEEYYSNHSYTSDNYFQNVMNNRRESFFVRTRRLREPYDKDSWDSAPSTVNAFYSFIKNQIMFPAGILQPPFFSQTYPRSLNYGGIGMVIGHEITHGFDDMGRQYDASGNLAQWWAEAAVGRFKAKAKCIVDQYANFTVPEAGEKINGINTQGENIADNGGLKQAFQAYRAWVAEQGKEEARLPGLPYSHNQLFFINFAQLWCNLMKKESAISRIRTGVHSPGRFRVIGSVQNSVEFAREFGCRPNAPMNPPDKCQVW